GRRREAAGGRGAARGRPAELSIEAFAAALDRAGLNLRAALPIARYDAAVPEPWRSAALHPRARSAVVIASGGRALWDAFARAPEFGAVPDPLDAYTRR